MTRSRSPACSAGCTRRSRTTSSPCTSRVVALGGRRFRPPFTARHLAVALTALTEGFTLRWSVDPGAVPTDLAGMPRMAGEDDDPGEPPWDLFSAVVYMLATGMTEPAGGAGEECRPAGSR